jgi:hypothetical protein
LDSLGWRGDTEKTKLIEKWINDAATIATTSAKTQLVISAHPLELLTSSDFAAFKSCHQWLTAQNCHGSGNWSYIQQPQWLILYTACGLCTIAPKQGEKTPTPIPEIAFPKKNWRQLVTALYCDPSHLMLWREYPNPLPGNAGEKIAEIAARTLNPDTPVKITPFELSQCQHELAFREAGGHADFSHIHTVGIPEGETTQELIRRIRIKRPHADLRQQCPQCLECAPIDANGRTRKYPAKVICPDCENRNFEKCPPYRLHCFACGKDQPSKLPTARGNIGWIFSPAHTRHCLPHLRSG